jgi:DNA-binding PadR family transcriptional regulator
MGNLYRYIEPAVLLLLKEQRHSYGYDLAEKLGEFALTDAPIDRAALYRTLRSLEESGHVTSAWDVEGAGPARRVYSLTGKGRSRLQEWAGVLHRLGAAMITFSQRARDGGAGGPADTGQKT